MAKEYMDITGLNYKAIELAYVTRIGGHTPPD